ncbi:hypothetical protein [Allokutzneria albata]|uniref:Uncharacterized protein n=1 Tax=Allokutzneria albata TaxID=211114 RepID=A0A1G9R2I8_ALLAB|nr:hypothetical protein [Allokutzneria albata]SDM17433.1 hypothetical protein SAMN04489726_0169 [Allokutzneria albata]
MTLISEPPASVQLPGLTQGLVPGQPALVVGDTVGAISMRAGLGAETNAMLSLHLLSGPVLGIPGHPERWVFLTGPVTPVRVDTVLDLVRIDVQLLAPGTRLALPPRSADEPGPRWVVRPRPGHDLPPWQAVVSAARSTSSMCRNWSNS